MTFNDAVSAAIVLGGTLVATVLRCGFGDCTQVLRALAGLTASRFDADQVRSSLARQVQEIQRDGLLCAHPRRVGDREFDEASDALIAHRSLDALLTAHQGHKARRDTQAKGAVATLAQSAELAPVFGLVGTLISLGKLPADGLDRGAYMMAIAMAVHATLYGLVAANLVLAPLARLVERRAAREQAERQSLVDWLAHVLAPASPPGADASERAPPGEHATSRKRSPLRGVA